MFFHDWLFGQMESVNVAGVLHESISCTRSQVSVDYFIIPYTFTFNRLSHLYQESHAHCVVIRNDGRIWKVEVVDFLGGAGGGGQGLGIIIELLTCAFVFCFITFSVPLRRWLEHNGCCVCFYVFFFIFFVSGPFH